MLTWCEANEAETFVFAARDTRRTQLSREGRTLIAEGADAGRWMVGEVGTILV